MSDISLEPLLNQGDVAGQGGLVTGVSELGKVSHRTPVTVINVAQEITIGAAKGSIEFENSGGSIVYYGGTGVTSANGARIFPNSKKIFIKVKPNFSIFLVTDGADTSTIRIIDYA